MLPLLVAFLLAPRTVHAQDAAPVEPGTTPRSTVTLFLERTRLQQWDAASEFIDAPGRRIAGGEVLASQLRAVLDRYVSLEPVALSDVPQGRLDDDLAPQFEDIARIPTPDGPEPVRLVRLSSGQWIFARETIRSVPTWYSQIQHRWLRDHLPAPLLRSGWLNLAWWQWIALPVVLIASVVLGRLLGWLLQRALHILSDRTESELDDKLIDRLARPRNLLLIGLLSRALLPYLELSRRAEELLTRATTVVLFFAIGWAALRTLDVLGDHARHSRFVSRHPMTLGFLPLGVGLSKLAVLAIALASLLQWFGLPVASLVASLGIGGLAVALAAKSTLENLLSAVTLGLDQPFRPGDFVKVEETVGIVERIGLRSTRIRTLDRTLITLPNAKVADAKIETFAARDRIRLACVIGLEYRTTAAQMREVLDGIGGLLRDHPLIWHDGTSVVFKEFTENALNIEVMAWFRTTDWNEFMKIRQDLYLAFMDLVQKAGTRFAHPTRTLHIASD